MSDVISFDGTRLTLRTTGPPDGPTVVLVHGLGAAMDSWAPVDSMLAERHRVVTYDLRGHGQSGGARSGDYGLAAHAQDLDHVLRAVIPDGRAAVVAGHSLGGAILLQRVDLFGCDRIAGAVFAASGASAVTVPGFPARGLPPVVEKGLRRAWLAVILAGARLAHRVRGTRRLTNRVFRRFAFAPGDPEHLVDRFREDFLSTSPRALAGTTTGSVTHDGTRLAPRLDVPALVVRGSADPEVSDDDVYDLMSGLPDGRLVDVPGAGHLLPWTRPGLLADQIAGWARHVTAAPARPDAGTDPGSGRVD